MKRNWKRIVAYILTVAMLLGVMPEASMVSYAEEVLEDTTEYVVTEETEATKEVMDEATEVPTEVTDSETEESTEMPIQEESTTEVAAELITETMTEATTELVKDECTTEVNMEEVKTEEATTEDVEELISTFDVEAFSAEKATNSKTIYSDGTWSGGIIWYVKDGSKKHYVFCLNEGATMYSGKYAGVITSGYNGIDAFRISTALNYFKTVNGGWNGKKNYGLVQSAIWETGESELMDYIIQAWKLASNNSSRSSGSSSFDNRLKLVSSVNTKGDRKKIAESLSAYKITTSNDGYYTKTYSLSGAAWKYFAKGDFPGNITSSAAPIEVIGLYDMEGKAVTGSYVADNYVDSAGKLHVKFPVTGDVGTKENPVTVIMKVNFPYQGANNIRYLKTGSGVQNLSFSTSANTSAYFAMQFYADNNPERIKPTVHINKVDEFGNQVTGCKFLLEGTDGDALTNAVSVPLTVNSPEDIFEIEYSGRYKITEIAVPNSEMKINKYPVEFDAVWEPDETTGVTKLVLHGLGDVASDSYSYTYTATNYYNEGIAKLVKYGNTVVSYKDGKFTYEKRKLSDVDFAFYAAEDIYCNEILVIKKGTKLKNLFGWGVHSEAFGAEGWTHYIKITNGSSTDENGEITLSGLPQGRYYAVETSTLDGFTRSSKKYYFNVVAGDTVNINGSVGIINEQAPAVCHVFKVDADTKEPLSGGEFTIYADVSNKNYKGKLLFNPKDTVPAVISRNISTGEEAVEENTWVPLQTVTTDSNGMAEFTDLPAGKYLVVETKAPNGYNLAEESYIFEHSYSTEKSSSGYNFEHTFRDIQKKSYEILKHGEKAVLDTENISTDVYIYEEEPIADVVFGIYAAETIYNTAGKKVADAGAQLGSCTTDRNGIATYSDILYPGNYYFKELQTADDSRYILDDTQYSFSVSGDSDARLNKTALVNELYKGSIKVIKTDGRTKEYLEDVEFKLLDAQQNVIGTYVTNDKGEILIDHLPVGTYYLQESKTQKGYKLDEEIKEIVLSADDLHKQVEMKNYRTDTKITIKTDTTYSGGGKVKTGDMSPVGLMFLLFFMSICGCVILACSKKKELVSARTRKLMALLLVLTGVIALGSLTVKAAAEYKEIALEELQDVEYNGTIYQYALQKQYETSNPEQEITFDEEVDGWKLADIQYELVDTILQKKMVEETRDYKNLIVKDEDKIAKTITLDDQVYELQGITWSAEPNIETVSYTVDYWYNTAEPTPDATYEYTYTSPVTKKDNTVTLPFVRLEQGGTDWVDGFSAIVTFHNLDGLYFTLGDNEITYNADKLSLTSSDYRELVKMLGYDTSKYRFNSISWDGKAYKKNNQKCRDAKATGQQYATLYKAIYEDEVENGKIYTAHATYACEVELPEEEAAPTYVMEATAYYEEANVWTNIISFVTEHKAVSVVAIIGILFFIILIIVSVMKKQTAKNKPVEWSSVKERPREE